MNAAINQQPCWGTCVGLTSTRKHTRSNRHTGRKQLPLESKEVDRSACAVALHWWPFSQSTATTTRTHHQRGEAWAPKPFTSRPGGRQGVFPTTEDWGNAKREREREITSETETRKERKKEGLQQLSIRRSLLSPPLTVNKAISHHELLYRHRHNHKITRSHNANLYSKHTILTSSSCCPSSPKEELVVRRWWWCWSMAEEESNELVVVEVAPCEVGEKESARGGNTSAESS